MPDGETGMVTSVQRFGGALNLHVHFHTLALDGVYVPGATAEDQSGNFGTQIGRAHV